MINITLAWYLYKTITYISHRRPVPVVTQETGTFCTRQVRDLSQAQTRELLHMENQCWPLHLRWFRFSSGFSKPHFYGRPIHTERKRKWSKEKWQTSKIFFSFVQCEWTLTLILFTLCHTKTIFLARANFWKVMRKRGNLVPWQRLVNLNVTILFIVFNLTFNA